MQHQLKKVGVVAGNSPSKTNWLVGMSVGSSVYCFDFSGALLRNARPTVEITTNTTWRFGFRWAYPFYDRIKRL